MRDCSRAKHFCEHALDFCTPLPISHALAMGGADGSLSNVVITKKAVALPSFAQHWKSVPSHCKTAYEGTCGRWRSRQRPGPTKPGNRRVASSQSSSRTPKAPGDQCSKDRRRACVWHDEEMSAALTSCLKRCFLRAAACILLHAAPHHRQLGF